jgi:hypothetical protein
MTSPQLSPPKAEDVDALAKEYVDIQAELLEKQLALATETEPKRERLAELSEKLRAWCVDFGSAHEKKSKLLVGLLFEVMTTVSSSSSLDQAAVDVFLRACQKAKALRVFRKIFEHVSYWRPRPQADQVSRGAGMLTGALAKKLMACTIVDTKPARLIAVRPRKGAAKRRRAEMAIGNHFMVCDICGGAGHKARSCGLRQLEERKDPFGEARRRQGYRERQQAAAQWKLASMPVQSSRTIGL